MLSELGELNSMLAEHAEDTQRFNAYTDLMHLSQKIANHLLKKQPKTKREVQKIMGGKVLELQSEKLIKKGKKAEHAEGYAEGYAEGRAEERKDGILALIAAAKDFSASPTQAAEQLMKRYSLTKEEAQTAVQANW